MRLDTTFPFLHHATSTPAVASESNNQSNRLSKHLVPIGALAGAAAGIAYRALNGIKASEVVTSVCFDTNDTSWLSVAGQVARSPVPLLIAAAPTGLYLGTMVIRVFTHRSETGVFLRDVLSSAGARLKEVQWTRVALTATSVGVLALTISSPDSVFALFEDTSNSLLTSMTAQWTFGLALGQGISLLDAVQHTTAPVFRYIPALASIPVAILTHHELTTCRNMWHLYHSLRFVGSLTVSLLAGSAVFNGLLGKGRSQGNDLEHGVGGTGDSSESVSEEAESMERGQPTPTDFSEYQPPLLHESEPLTISQEEVEKILSKITGQTEVTKSLKKNSLLKDFSQLHIKWEQKQADIVEAWDGYQELTNAYNEMLSTQQAADSETVDRKKEASQSESDFSITAPPPPPPPPSTSPSSPSVGVNSTFELSPEQKGQLDIALKRVEDLKGLEEAKKAAHEAKRKLCELLFGPGDMDKVIELNQLEQYVIEFRIAAQNRILEWKALELQPESLRAVTLDHQAPLAAKPKNHPLVSTFITCLQQQAENQKKYENCKKALDRLTRDEITAQLNLIHTNTSPSCDTTKLLESADKMRAKQSELKEKSDELEQATSALEKANDNLKKARENLKEKVDRLELPVKWNRRNTGWIDELRAKLPPPERRGLNNIPPQNNRRPGSGQGLNWQDILHPPKKRSQHSSEPADGTNRRFDRTLRPLEHQSGSTYENLPKWSQLLNDLVQLSTEEFNHKYPALIDDPRWNKMWELQATYGKEGELEKAKKDQSDQDRIRLCQYARLMTGQVVWANEDQRMTENQNQAIQAFGSLLEKRIHQNAFGEGS